jgi:hypothetical protein
MAFNPEEKAALLAIKGVGETVLSRLESIGLDSFAALKTAKVDDILLHISQLLQATCWRNSPQAKKAIQAIVDYAKTH